MINMWFAGCNKSASFTLQAPSNNRKRIWNVLQQVRFMLRIGYLPKRWKTRTILRQKWSVGQVFPTQSC